MPSDEAVRLLEKELDFVYIDGSHLFKHVYADLYNYYQHVKQGGLVICHDFDFPDIHKAVIKFLRFCSMEGGIKYHVQFEETLGGPYPVYECWWTK